MERCTAFRLATVFSACIDDLCHPHKSPRAAARRRFLFWTTGLPAPSLRRGGGTSLSTPWGSFTSLSGGAHAAEQQAVVGWKRRKRTVKREPRELDVYELQRRGGLRKVKDGTRRWPSFLLSRTTNPCADLPPARDDDLPSGSISPSPSDTSVGGATAMCCSEAEDNALNEAIAAASAAAASPASGYCSNASTAGSASTRLSALTEPDEQYSCDRRQRPTLPSAFPPFHAPPQPHPPSTPHPARSANGCMLPRSDHPPMFTFERLDDVQSDQARGS